VADLAPLSLADLDAGASALGTDRRLGGTRAEQREVLRELHELMIRAVPASTGPPAGLATAASVAVLVTPAAADGMQPRPRTVFRLLRANALDAAWAVITESSVGRVDAEVAGATATGGRRTTRRLPVPVRIESSTVYAALPGFRDPRYDAPDECYDMTALVRLVARADDVAVDADIVTIGGSAALAHLPTRSDESVQLILVGDLGERIFAGRRRQRPDLFPGRAHLPVRRDWAGWSAAVDCASLPAATWQVFVELAHDHVVRRAAAGVSTDGTGIGDAGANVALGPMAHLEVRPDGWWLVTTGNADGQVPG